MGSIELELGGIFELERKFVPEHTRVLAHKFVPEHTRVLAHKCVQERTHVLACKREPEHKQVHKQEQQAYNKLREHIG